MKVSLIAVCHHSSAVLPRCVASFRRQAERAAVEAEVVAVEQSEDSREASAVAASGVDRIVERPNRGYAAGLNAGVAEASGEVVLLANPDIEFLDGSVAAMLRTLDRGWDVVGPRLVWDDESRILLPIPEDPSPAAELVRTLRRRWQPVWELGLHRALAASWRVWTAPSDVSVPSLRGPLLGATGDTLARLGPLDEGYFLYYEETDWLWRARRRGARLAVAGEAPVAHRWGHATGRATESSEIEEASRQRFFSRYYGPLWRLVLRWAAAGGGRAGIETEPVTGPHDIPAIDPELWLLAISADLQPVIGCLGGPLPIAEVLRMTMGRRWLAAAAARRAGGWRITAGWSWS